MEPWERRREIELLPWQAELIVSLSNAYMVEMHEAKQFSAICPWPKGRNMWKYVMDKKHERHQAEQKEKERLANGSYQRHRNPPKG